MFKLSINWCPTCSKRFHLVVRIRARDIKSHISFIISRIHYKNWWYRFNSKSYSEFRRTRWLTQSRRLQNKMVNKKSWRRSYSSSKISSIRRSLAMDVRILESKLIRWFRKVKRWFRNRNDMSCYVLLLFCSWIWRLGCFMLIIFAGPNQYRDPKNLSGNMIAR